MATTEATRTTDAPAFSVGDKLWVTWSEHRVKATSETISKVGRKWVEIRDGRYRFSLSDPWMRLDGKGYTSPGCCYLERQIWADEMEREYLWTRLRKQVESYAPPKNLDLHDLRTAMMALGISTEEIAEIHQKIERM